MKKFLPVIVFLVSSGNSFGARIVGIEKPRVEQPAADDANYTLMDRVEEAIEPLRSLEYTLAAGFGSSGFLGSVTIGYPMGPYVLIDTTGFYARESDESRGYNMRSGVNSDLVLRLGRRKSVIVPFGGTGLGFERWDQYLTKEIEQPVSSRNDNATVSQFAGIAFKLGENTQMKLTSRWLTWLDNPPRDLATRFESRLPRRERRMDLGIGYIF